MACSFCAGPLWASLGLCASLWAFPSLSEPLWANLSPSEPLWTHVSLSGSLLAFFPASCQPIARRTCSIRARPFWASIGQRSAQKYAAARGGKPRGGAGQAPFVDIARVFVHQRIARFCGGHGTAQTMVIPRCVQRFAPNPRFILHNFARGNVRIYVFGNCRWNHPQSLQTRLKKPNHIGWFYQASAQLLAHMCAIA